MGAGRGGKVSGTPRPPPPSPPGSEAAVAETCLAERRGLAQQSLLGF